MFRKHVPDLDSLESPLISANPFGSILGAVPGTALAEKIFNDPDSWQTADDDDDDLHDTAEAIAWLAEEVDTCHVSTDGPSLSPVDRDVDLMLKPLSEKLNLSFNSGSEANWKGMEQVNKMHLPLFNHTSLDLSLNVDLRLSKIWDSKGKMFQSPESPADSPEAVTPVADNTRIPAPPALNLGAADNTLSPIVSPFPIASASTTWSILEWYGVHPNTPRANGRVPFLTHFPPTPHQPKAPGLSSLRAPSSPSANATVMCPPSPTEKAAPLAPESTPIRRLPLIPDPNRNSPSPTPSPAPSRVSTPPQRTSPEPFVTPSTSQRSLTPNGPTSGPRRTPRGFATPPTPSASPDPFSASPNVTPIRSGGLFIRSPPAGPRPRSGTPPIKQRRPSSRTSPAPVVIAPAPTPMRARRPSPPPGLRLEA
ncbi:hypothetical protein H0H92_006744 [Tricholoma furcatifolium]|nr:hypothetical protein H0H92_006744 [Tricholoma furcatifolium]